MAWTLLRPTGFMQNTLAWGTRVLNNTFYSPVPDAAFSIVDARDVAEVAAVALTEDGHEGKAYGLSGPEAVSYRDQAKRLFEAAGRDIEVEEIPIETLKRELVRAGVPPWNAEGLKELFEVYASGGAQMVTSGVKDVAGPRAARHRRLRVRPRGFVQGEAMTVLGARESRRSPTTRSSRSSIRTRSWTPRRASRWTLRADHRRAARDTPGAVVTVIEDLAAAAAGHRRRLPAPAPAQPPPGQAARDNMDGIFGALPNVAWTSAGPVDPADLTTVQLRARRTAGRCRSSASTSSRA